jgi:hypothetical protein
MQKVLFIMLLILTPVAAANEEDLSFPFSSDSGKYWQYISDQTMGGVSSGQVTLEQDGDLSFARLTGNVSTRNNGGFIQLRSGVSFATSEKNGKALRGVRLNVRGNGETYNIFIRTNETRSYSDYYSASFKADTNWQVIDLPFEQFKRKRSLNSTLYSKNIRTFAIVAYGRDFTADVSVSKLEFYY